MTASMDGKVAVVTGGNGGMGFTTLVGSTTLMGGYGAGGAGGAVDGVDAS